MVLLFYFFFASTAFTSLRLTDVELSEKKIFENERNLQFLETQLGNDYQDTNCFYAVLSTVINNKKGFQKWKPDDLKKEFTVDLDEGASLLTAMYILNKENISYSVYTDPKSSENIMKLFKKHNQMIIPLNIEEGLHVVMVTDYIKIKDVYIVKYFDPNFDRMYQETLERLLENKADYLFWIGIN